MAKRWWRTLALGAAVLAGAPAVLANGRFPAAQDVHVGPGDRADVITLRTTFGLLVSFDAGATFRWLCEDAMYFPVVVGPQIDPAVEIAADGTVVYGFEAGIHSTHDGCRVERHPTAMNRYIADLTSDPSGRTILAIEADLGTRNHVLRAEGGSLSFARLGAGVPDVLFATLDLAPSDARRVYASGRTDDARREPRLYRSDDGGATLTMLTPSFGMGEDAYIAGVDPTNPDVLFLRSNLGVGSVLLRSRDGGRSLERVAQTRGPMLGFALSPDGRRVWYGGPDDGLHRSDDGGDTFARVNDLAPLCLRFHAGALYACADWLRLNYALGRSRDGGASFEPLLRFTDVRGAFACNPPTEGGAICVERWPSQLRLIENPVPDAGRPDDVPRPPRDAGADAGRVDAGTSAPPPPPGDCGCDVPGGARRPGAALVAALSALAGAAVARRRRAR